MKTMILIALMFLPIAATSQSDMAALPTAPKPVSVSFAASDLAPSSDTPSLPAQPEAQQTPSDTGLSITRADAERLALKNNPHITADRLLALAAGQVTRQTRSAELPQIGAAITAAKAEDGARIGAGSLTDSRLYTHAGAGGTLSQLITDFGHTQDLVASSKLQQKAQDKTALATEQDVLLATDEAFYRLLDAQSLLQVAKATVEARDNVR